MELFALLGWDVYALGALAVIVFSLPERGHPLNRLERVFLGLVLSNAVLLALQIVARAEIGAAAPVYALLFAVGVIPPFLWIVYVGIQTYNRIDSLVPTVRVLVILASIHALSAVLSVWSGFLFEIGADNTFERGPGFWLTPALNLSAVVYATISVLHFRPRLTYPQFQSMIAFPVFPLIGAIAEIMVSEVHVFWSAWTLSILLVFVNVQHRRLYTDYLTGLNNRRQLDAFLQRRVSASERAGPLGLVMIDMDDFKSINDTYGHAEGDAAITAAARVLSSALRQNDFIARYAGDEFVAALDVDTEGALESAVYRIRGALNEYNHRTDKPYNINCSIGYGLFDVRDGASLDSYIEQIDQRMYTEKRSKKADRREGGPTE